MKKGRTQLAAAFIAMSFVLGAGAMAADATTSGTIQRLEGQVKPNLSIPIPTLKFSDITYTEGDNTRILDIPFLAQYIAAIYKYGVAIAGVVAAVLMTVGGFQYLTAGGDSARVSAAKERITNAIVGLVLSLGTYTVLAAINPDLVNLKSLRTTAVKRIPFEDSKFDKPTGADGDSSAAQSINNPAVPAAVASVVPSPTSDLDKIFYAYASCFDLDWRFLKAVASAESSLNPNLGSGAKYQGLFQESIEYCNQGIGKFPFLNCNNRLDPEVNTAAAVAVIGPQVKQILAKCPSATVTEVASLLYVAHNNGPGFMKSMINKGGCALTQQRVILLQAYTCPAPQCNISTSPSRDECVRSNFLTKNHPVCGERKWAYGVTKVAGPVASNNIGIKGTYPDKSICPQTTGKRVQ